jgi:DNA invertase Pin-like site-specific DNA recombinase
MKEQLCAWLYCRIDAPEDTHGTLKSQKEELYDYAEQMGFVVAGYAEDLGSGLNLSRSGLQETEKAANENQMDVLVVKRLDRIGRDTAQVLEFLRGLDQLGIAIYSPLEGEIRLEQQGLDFFLR